MLSWAKAQRECDRAFGPKFLESFITAKVVSNFYFIFLSINRIVSVRQDHTDISLLSFPFPATVPGRGEREGSLVPLSTDGQIGGLSPLRPPSRRWESGGARDLCFRCVYSRLGLPGGGGRVVSASRWWNNGAGARLPPRLRPLWRCRRASGVWCPPFCGSGGMCCLGRGRGGEGDDLAVALLSPISVFAAVRWAPASPWSFWGLVWSCSCWCVTPASLAGRGGEVRSGSVGVLAAAWWWWFLVFGCALLWLLRCLHRPSPAGRGGEGGSAGDAVLRAAAGRKVGWCFFGLELLPVQGRRSDGGTSGAGGRSSATGAGSRLRASWPMLVHRFRSRRLTAGGSCSSKAWRCSPFQVSWWPAFLSSPGDWEWRRPSRMISFLAVVRVVRFRLFWPVCVLVLCSVPLL